jgi:pimeloyl-ACP methyl ester carboxylesterase
VWVVAASGTPIVLIHGFGVDHRLLLPLDPTIEAHGGWRRVYLDLPGMGASPADGIDSSEDLVAAVEAAIDAEVGGEPFAVLGASYGAMVARRVAHDRPVLGLASIAGVSGPAGGTRDLPPRTVLPARTAQDAAWWASLGDDDPALADYREMVVVPSRAGLEEHRRWVQPGVEAADTRALARLRARYSLDAEPEATDVLFERPTLFLTGRQDQAVGWRDAGRLLPHYPRATYLVLDAAGHNVHLDQPVQTATAITAWLDRVRESSAD